MTSFCDIHLRALEPEDLELLYRIENDAAFWRCGTTTVPYSRYILRQYLQSATYDLFADQQVRFVVEGTAPEGQPHALGLADLTNFSPQHLRAEISLAILPEYQGRHVGTSALQALVDYARSQHLHQLYAIISTSNHAASSVFQRIGFEKTARLQGWLRDESAFSDADLWQQFL